MDRDDRKARDAIPEWDGNPSRWRHFETAVKWFPRTLKKQERDLAANRIIGRMLQSRVVAIRTFATTLDPDRYETHDGHLLLLEDLRASPLGKLPIPDAAHKIKHYYKDFKRKKGETVGALLIREQDCYTEMVQALERLLEEMGETEQYKRCAQCEGYFEGANGSLDRLGDRGRWYCSRCWTDYRATEVAEAPSTTTSQEGRRAQTEAAEAEAVGNDDERWGEADSTHSNRSRRSASWAERQPRPSVSHAIAVGTTQFGPASGVLRVLRPSCSRRWTSRRKRSRTCA